MLHLVDGGLEVVHELIDGVLLLFTFRDQSHLLPFLFLLTHVVELLSGQSSAAKALVVHTHLELVLRLFDFLAELLLAPNKTKVTPRDVVFNFLKLLIDVCPPLFDFTSPALPIRTLDIVVFVDIAALH